MPAKCPWCETNTHEWFEGEEECDRDFLNFLTKQEAKELIFGDKPKIEYHVFVNPKFNMLVGADWSLESLSEMIDDAFSIELTDPHGEARRMNHGIAIEKRENSKVGARMYFVETDKERLLAYEKLHGLPSPTTKK
jgi:hypothetical protein